MTNTNSKLVRSIRIAAGVVLFAALALAGYLFFPTIWIDKSEGFGLKVGMNRSAVLDALASHQVVNVIPDVAKDDRFGKGNIREIHRAFIPPNGLCVNDFAGSIALAISMDPDSGVIRQKYSSTRTFKWPIAMTIEDVISQLQSALDQNPDLRIATCLPEAHWVNIEAVSEDEKTYLNQYAAWSFSEHSRQLPVKLTFVNDVLSRIELGWTMYTPQ
jgi:hypothetical protein